ncbi:MAG: protoporphyrinogen/coproporphyrinogen oxidase [Nannocystaceae bacterium]|nr:FAD-dependent oxidoreductase [bacterium]
MQSTDVIVVGGGIAGLSCAALLARGGQRVVVLERGAAVGGLARTATHKGFSFNRGAHALYRGGAAQSVLASLEISLPGGSPALDGVAYWGGGRHRLPSSPWPLLTTGLLSVRGRWALGTLFASVRTLEAGEESAAQWAHRRMPDAPSRAFLSAMLRLSTYCGDLEGVRAADAVAALRQATVHGVRYLDGGWQRLVGALEAACARLCVEVRTRAPVEDVQPRGVTLRSGEAIEARHVVLAVPPSLAARWADVPSLNTAAVACLDVALRERPAGPGLAFDLDDPMYLSVHSDTATLGPGAMVHTLHYGAVEDARARLEGLLDRALPGWREQVVHTQFLPRIVVTEGIVPPGPHGRPGVRAGGLWRVGDAVGSHGGLADAAFGSAQEVAHAILAAAEPRAA